MLTLYSIPKPSIGKNAVIQRNAIHSWTLLRPTCEIILFGDDEGTADIAKEFNIRHIPHVVRNEYGTPLVNDVFYEAQKAATYDYLCYVNADIILMNDLMEAVKQVARQQKRFLMVGRRWDLDIENNLCFGKHWEEKLHAMVKQSGKLHSETGIDYFIFPKGLWDDIPPFAIGRFSWDNWLVYRARALKVALIDASSSVIAVHQNHDYHHSGVDKKSIFKGPEAILNRKLLGGDDYSFNVFDATHVLIKNNIKKPVDIWHIWRYLNKLPFLFPFPELVKPLLIKVSRFSHQQWLRFKASYAGNC